MGCDVGGGDIGGFVAEAVGELDEALGETLADGDSERDADDVGVFEFDAGALVTVVQEDVEAGSFKCEGDLLATKAEGVFADVGDGDDGGEGGDGGWKGVGGVGGRRRSRSLRCPFGAHCSLRVGWG